ncbi:MAG: hypothetical protein R3E79_26840 [Caldilineaceae bacterium]
MRQPEKRRNALHGAVWGEEPIVVERLLQDERLDRFTCGTTDSGCNSAPSRGVAARHGDGCCWPAPIRTWKVLTGLTPLQLATAEKVHLSPDSV